MRACASSAGRNRWRAPSTRLPYASPMAYPRNLIQDGETVALDLRPHWWYFSRNILTGIPLVVILLLVLNWDSGSSFVNDSTRWIVVIVTLVWVGWLVLK